jgi:glycosyltransferase involved in cell wall biosynthesis
MRAAHFVQRYPPALGGSEAYFARLSNHLAAAGDSITVFTTTAIPLESFWSIRSPCLPPSDLVLDGVRIRRFPLWRMPGRRYLLKPLSFIPHRFWQCLTLPCNPISFPMWAEAGRCEESFDIVHATAFPYAWPIACALRMARRLGVPFVVTPFLHLGDPEDPADPVRRAYTSPALLDLLRSADRVFVQTPSERDLLLERGLPADKLVLQGLGVDPAECSGGNRLAARQRWNIPVDAVVIGHLANHSAEKGTIDLLQAAQVLWQRGQRFTLVLAGPAMPNFRRFWDRFNPAGTVLRLGVLGEDEKRDFFAALDLFALPSRSDSFGLVLLEAWANALPNVAYRAGGIADLIHDGDDGLLVRCGAIPALAEALERLITDADLRRRLGLRGQERTRSEFRWNEKLELVRATYEELLEKRSLRTESPPVR